MAICLLPPPKCWDYGHAPWHLAVLLVLICYLGSLFSLVSDSCQCHAFESSVSTFDLMILLKSSGERETRGRLLWTPEKQTDDFCCGIVQQGNHQWCGDRQACYDWFAFWSSTTEKAMSSSRVGTDRLLCVLENSSSFCPFTHTHHLPTRNRS